MEISNMEQDTTLTLASVLLSLTSVYKQITIKYKYYWYFVQSIRIISYQCLLVVVQENILHN